MLNRIYRITLFNNIWKSYFTNYLQLMSIDVYKIIHRSPEGKVEVPINCKFILWQMFRVWFLILTFFDTRNSSYWPWKTGTFTPTHTNTHTHTHTHKKWVVHSIQLTRAYAATLDTARKPRHFVRGRFLPSAHASFHESSKQREKERESGKEKRERKIEIERGREREGNRERKRVKEREKERVRERENERERERERVAFATLKTAANCFSRMLSQREEHYIEFFLL